MPPALSFLRLPVVARGFSASVNNTHQLVSVAMHLLETHVCILDRELTKPRRGGKFGVAAGNRGDRREQGELGLAAFELRR